MDKIFNSKFEHSIISSGKNFPNFNPQKDSLDLFLVALHNNIEIESFQKKVGWTDSILKDKTDFLKRKNWLNDQGKPTVFITSFFTGNMLKDFSKLVSEEIALSIENNIDKIRKKYSSTEISKQYSFEDISFLILSNVLLDNWQIENVENKFLKGKRPLRHGKNYYYSIIENPYYPKEKFGIYGNQCQKANDSLTLCIYGNNRISLLKKIRKEADFKSNLINESPILNTKDEVILQQIANDYAPNLLGILNKNQEDFVDIYQKTGYSDQITFNEFFIWWYHIIYTQVTDILASKNKLKIPENGNFPYLLINN